MRNVTDRLDITPHCRYCHKPLTLTHGITGHVYCEECASEPTLCPPVKGGQGRTGEDVAAVAWVIIALIVAGVAAVGVFGGWLFLVKG